MNTASGPAAAESIRERLNRRMKQKKTSNILVKRYTLAGNGKLRKRIYHELQNQG